MNGDVWPAPTPEDRKYKELPAEALVVILCGVVALLVFWLCVVGRGLTPPTLPTVEALK